VVGGGFIGLEMAENLCRRGISVSLVEMSPQVMPPLDPEMASFVAERLREHGVDLFLGAAVAGFEKETAGSLMANTASGDKIVADIVILAIGIRPETKLAQDAGLELGERGGIRVDERMRTSDPRIWAVGDAVEVRDFVINDWQLVPLAGPANRQGRIAAASIIGYVNAESCTAAETMRFRGVQGTAVCGVFGLTIALTGASERTLRNHDIAYEKVYLHPGSHVGYYPGAKPIHMKLLFDANDGHILGAQAVGEEGTARRIDVIAMSIQMGGTVFDLEEAELCYAPQYGAAKDPVNLAGMIAANHLRGDLPLAKWEELADSKVQILDVRSVAEFRVEHLNNAKNIPLEELRDRLHELPGDREIWLVCGVGQRAYYATRLLMQGGYKVKNLSGGMQTHHGFGAAWAI
ncbi:FAD-dependent oxidoreductase, partial [bacterium]|nr:FAD-dependent oxidoreductase [bacterium]